MPEIILDPVSDERIRTGKIWNNDGSNFGAGAETRGFIALEKIDEEGNNVNICRKCHDECKYGCRGQTDKDCIHPDISFLPAVAGCKNVQMLDGYRHQCLAACPKGYFTEEQPPVLGKVRICKDFNERKFINPKK